MHAAAAGWFAAHGSPVEAVRHAQAAQDWELAARLLAGHWPALHLDGQAAATVHELLAGFPDQTRAADAELAIIAAADELARGSLEAAERYLALAERHAASAGRHLPRSWAGSPGSILVSAASTGASALTVTPVAASREARKWVSPALDAA